MRRGSFIDDPLHRSLLFIAPIYWVGLMMVSRQIHRSMTRALELNQELEETKLGLENRVSERTAELRRANAQLRQLTNAIEQSVEMVVIIDLAEKIEYVNPMVVRQSGYRAEELIGQDFQQVLNHGEADQFNRDSFELVREGGEWTSELEHVTKSGKTYITEMTMSPIYDDAHELTHFLAIMREITKRKALEQSLLQASKLSSLGVLISGIAHELNTPLATIRGFSSKISKEKGLGKEVKQYADWVLEESERCVTIVKNLLGFSRKYEPNTSLFNLNEMISGVIKLYHHPLKSDLIQVVESLEKRPLMVKGDSGQLQQVILNIFQNARKAIQKTKLKGRITIRTCRTRQIRTENLEDKDPVMEAHMMIENSGPPIPSNHLEKIFDPFFTTMVIGEGTGLGLSLSYGIVKEHGGRIWAENMENKGVCFHVTLPLAILGTGEELPVSSKPEDYDTSFLVGLRILLVEDDLNFRIWLVGLLETYGALVSQARNGYEAIGQLNSEEVDVILSDLKMPEMDGLSLCRWLEKARPEYLKKMVFLTGIVEDDLKSFCLEREVPILLKPVEETMLIKTLKTISEGMSQS